MMKPEQMGVALAAVVCMAGQCFAGESSVRAHLADNASTAYLQAGDLRLELTESGKRASADALVFQKFVGDLRLHGGKVVVIENLDGSIARVFDDSTEDLEFRRGQLNVRQDGALQLAEGLLPGAMDFAAEQVWFRRGNEASLAWEVTSSLPDLGVPASPTHYEMVIDAETGDLLSERQIDTKTYAPGSPEAADGVFPRIVINNAIGGAGSRSYAAPFDAVVQIGGCTGTLIAPNVVLSARHCGIGAGSSVRVGTNLASPIFFTTVQSSILPDGFGTLLDGGDVSIHILNSSVPANIAQPMRLIDETTALEGQVAATIGYGLNGLGSTGHQGTSDGRRWGGENTIEIYGRPASANGSNVISTDFDNGSGGANTIPSSSSTPLQFEATTAPGDSGGPILVQLGGEWVIAGVLSGGTTNTSAYGDISWWTGTAIYRSDIEDEGGEFFVDLNSVFTELPISDPFATTSLDTSVWTGNDGTQINTLAINEPSPPNSLNLDGTDSLGSALIDASLLENITVAYAWQRGGNGNPPEANEDLVLEFLDAADNWIEADRQFGGGSDSSFTQESVVLPQAAEHGNLRVRFRATSGDNNADDWFVDDVEVSASLQAPGVFSLSLPINGAEEVSINPFFDWSNSIGATNYTFTIDDDPDFSSPIVETTTSNSFFGGSLNLPQCTEFFWRVVANNPGGQTDASPMSASFTTGANCVSACPGDVDGSGDTNVADISLVVSNLGAGAAGAAGTPGDANGDGVTATNDITFVVGNLGCSNS